MLRHFTLCLLLAMRELATALPFIVQWALRGQSTNSIVWLCLHRVMRYTVPGGQIAAEMIDCEAVQPKMCVKGYQRCHRLAQNTHSRTCGPWLKLTTLRKGDGIHV